MRSSLCVMLLSGLLLLCLCSTAVLSDDGADAIEARQAMIDMLAAMEQAAGLDSRGSDGIRYMDDVEAKEFFSSLENRDEFVAAAYRIVARIEAVAMDPHPAYDSVGTPASKAGDSSLFAPAYPGSNDVNFGLAHAYGLVDYPWNRCSGKAFDDWQLGLFIAASLMDHADSACSVAGCDPSGLVCVAVCGSVEIAQIAYRTAKKGMDACIAHDGNVDSAEIEAGYENGVSIHGDVANMADIGDELRNHDANIDHDLRLHDANIDHDLRLHDANIDHDLTIHDQGVRTTLSQLSSHLAALQQSIDTNVEVRSIDLQIIEVIPQRRFLVGMAEGGAPVDGILIGVKTSKLADDGVSVEFVNVPAVANPIAGATGLLDVSVDLPDELVPNARMFQFLVKDIHRDSHGKVTHEHFGTLLHPARGPVNAVVAPHVSGTRSKRSR